MRRGASEYSAVYLSNYLGLAWPSALVGGMPMRRTLYFELCACLLANQAYEDPESHRLWRQGGDVLDHANTGFQTWEFLEGSCNLSAAQFSWAHPCHWSCMQGGQASLDHACKAANLSSTLIISCARSAQRNFPLLSWKTCGVDLAGVGGRSWMRLGASCLLLPRRWLRSDGRWSLGQEQQALSAASWVTEQPYLGSTLLTSTRGAEKRWPKNCHVCSIVDPNGRLRPLGHPSQQSTTQAISKISTH